MGKLKILVVDDESRMRKLVKDFLMKKDFDVLEAGDGEQAVDIFFEEKDIALIILDVMMPKMDGWQVCREIRAHSRVPIIMLTAKSDERDELMGFNLGVDEYISKPFSPKILVARVEAILRRSGHGEQEDVLTCGGIELNKTCLCIIHRINHIILWLFCCRLIDRIVITLLSMVIISLIHISLIIVSIIRVRFSDFLRFDFRTSRGLIF